jgi:hypothetical protein
VLELVGDPLDRRALADGEALERSRCARRRTRHRIAVRACLRIAEDAHEALLHLLRHRVLDALGLLVRLPPFVPEEIDEHPFGEAVAPDDPARCAVAAVRETDLLPLVELQKPVALEAMHHLRHRRGRDPKELGETRADHLAALVGEGVHGLEVLLGRRGGLRRHS